MVFLTAHSETLFEVKDASNNTVLDVSTDGLRVMNEGDTLMIISSDAIRANIGVTNKGLSRSFSVTTASSKGKGLINALEVDSKSASMTSPLGKYTDFSPSNIFIGLNSGQNTQPGTSDGYMNVFLGNNSGLSNISGRNNIFMGEYAGENNVGGSYDNYFGEQVATGNNNIYLGTYAGRANDIGYQNVMIGSYSNMAGKARRSTFVGRYTGWASEGYDNVFIGADAAKNNKYGNMNVLIGEGSGYKLGETVAAYYNTFVGDRTGFSNTAGTGNVFLGYNAGYNETGSNKLYISNSNTSTPLIKGNFPNIDLSLTASNININGTLNGNLTSETISGSNYLRITSQNTASPGIELFRPGTGSYDWRIYNSSGNLRIGISNDDLLTVTDLINITLGGYVGIGNTTPGQKLDITAGNGRVEPGYSWLTSSDKRLKKNISTLESPLSNLKKLRGVRYDLNEDNNIVPDRGKHIGFIAQELEEVYSELVSTDDKGYKSVAYDKIGAVLVEAVKELDQKTNEEIERLRKENQEIRKELEEIKKIINKD